MFDFDNWLEIFHTIKKNKLRTFLTGFSVAWGIFMLIILLASGNGLKNGVMSNFQDRASNSLEMWGRRTSMPYNGIPDGRQIRLDEKDFSLIQNKIEEAENISASVTTNVVASFGNEFTECDFIGVYPTHAQINGVKIKGGQGRFINDIDMQGRRKVAIINKRLKEILFKDEDPIGKTIIANKLSFIVAGVYEGGDWGDEKKAYIPFSAAQQLFNKGWGIGSISFTVKGLETKEENEKFEKDLRKKLASLHQYHPDDERAIGIWNRLEEYLQTTGIFNVINIFVLIMACGTLLAAIVGVGNIMMIAVRERTKEFGIRKALGAKPRSILQLIFMESIIITGLFGYIGMFMGLLLSETVNYFLEQYYATNPADDQSSFLIFLNPTVDVGVAINATLLLIVSGVLAGLLPAYKAVKVTAIEAMRTE